MGKWGMVRLGDVFLSIKNGASIKQGKPEGTGYPVTRIETISDGRVNRSKMGYAGIEELGNYSDFILNSEDILMSHINSIKHLGKTALYTRQGAERIIHGMNLLRLQPDKRILDSAYANYYFGSSYFKHQIPKITKNSVNQSSFTITALKELVIPLPPLEVQRKIVEALNRAFALIEKRKTQTEKLDLLIKSRFIEMFGDPGVNPRNWTEVRLSNILKGSPGNGIFAKNEDYGSDGFEVIWLSDFIDKRSCDITSLKRINTQRKIEQYAVRYGDMLFCRSSLNRDGIGKCSFVPHINRTILFECHIIRISIDLDLINPIYLQMFSTCTFFRNQIFANAKTSTMTTISQQGLLNCSIHLPPLTLQENFARFLIDVESKNHVLKQSQMQLEVIYNSLMQKCFRGEFF